VTVGELIEQLKAIVNVHNDALEAQVWAYNLEDGDRFQIKNIGYDKKHKPARIKLE